jgi:hypothetical protein
MELLFQFNTKTQIFSIDYSKSKRPHVAAFSFGAIFQLVSVQSTFPNHLNDSLHEKVVRLVGTSQRSYIQFRLELRHVNKSNQNQKV